MAAKLVKVERESYPAVRLIGKRYTDADRQNGTFGAKWGEWWQNGWFEQLEQAGNVPENDNGYLGAMRVKDGVFEYWIGMFLEKGTAVPEGFAYEDIEAADYGMFWVYGKEDNGELFGMDVHNMCMETLTERGWKYREDGWCIERYNCPRYTTPDEQGNVILDYGIAIEK